MAREIINKLLIRGGLIIDPAQEIEYKGDILISGGKIAGITEGDVDSAPADCVVMDAAGMIISPGFIDMHCHLRQPGGEEQETIATGSRAAARGGFTTICCMPNTSPPLDNPAGIDYIMDIASREAAVRVLPIGCVTVGREGHELAQLDEMTKARVIAFSDDGSPVWDAQLMKAALEFSLASGSPIIDHCEDIKIAGNGVMNEGELSRKLGLKGIPAAAEEAMVARDLALAEETGGHLHIAHVSTSGSVELIRKAKEQGVNVTAEATPHHLTLTEAMADGLKTSAKVNPPLRTAADVAALVRGLKDGVIDIIATDHAPHTEADKKLDFEYAPFGISGFETALGSLMKLVHSGKLGLSTLIACLTTKPAQIIRQKRLGTLRDGMLADISIIHPEKEWVVDVQGFVSKGKNTPLDGATLKGRVMATIARGRLVYLDNSINIGEKVVS